MPKCDISCDRQRHAQDIVRDSHATTVGKMSKSIRRIMNAAHNPGVCGRGLGVDV